MVNTYLVGYIAAASTSKRRYIFSGQVVTFNASASLSVRIEQAAEQGNEVLAMQN